MKADPSATGIPFTVFAQVTAVVQQVLKQLCIFDGNLLDYVQAPIEALLNNINSFVDGIVSKIEMLKKTVNDLINLIMFSPLFFWFIKLLNQK